MFIDETRELGGGFRVGSKIDPISYWFLGIFEGHT